MFYGENSGSERFCRVEILRKSKSLFRRAILTLGIGRDDRKNSWHFWTLLYLKIKMPEFLLAIITTDSTRQNCMRKQRLRFLRDFQVIKPLREFSRL